MCHPLPPPMPLLPASESQSGLFRWLFVAYRRQFLLALDVQLPKNNPPPPVPSSFCHERSPSTVGVT